MKEHLHRIELPYACGGILTRANRVFAAPPIFSWMIDKHLDEVYDWVVRKKHGKLILVESWGHKKDVN